MAVGVPAAVLLKPQRLLIQVRTRHAVSCPGQSAAITHSPQAPLPSQMRPPGPQTVPTGDTGFEGVPAVHTSSVQALLSLGTSVLSVALTTVPAPSHSLARQSPAVCIGVRVPAGL